MNLFQRRKPPAQETAPQFFGGTDNVPQPKAVLPQSTFMENLRKLSVKTRGFHTQLDEGPETP